MHIKQLENKHFLLLYLTFISAELHQEPIFLATHFIKMLFLLVSCLSFVLLSHSFYKPYSTSKTKSKMWSFYEPLHTLCGFLGKKRKIFIRASRFPKKAPSIKRFLSARYDLVEERDHEEEEREGSSLLDLPDLALDCILENLSPLELCQISAASTSLREKCTSDHLWEKLIKQKWGGVIGDFAFREWKRQISSKRSLLFLSSMAKRSQFRYFLLEFFGVNTDTKQRKDDAKSSLSVKSFYLALESGKFWFPAQVYNRENGHVGFMLSCYDAWLSYDSTTDNFVARYPAQGRSLIEEGIKWSRLRATSVITPANVLHKSDCLDELKPDDHIEIQWRKNKEFPYGWWYGVVGHLDSCTGNQFNCQCHINDTVVLEFKQYSEGSRWRKTIINRRGHKEVGNQADGFYGGIKKLTKIEEIEKWRHLWPNCTLE